MPSTAPCLPASLPSAAALSLPEADALSLPDADFPPAEAFPEGLSVRSAAAYRALFRRWGKGWLRSMTWGESSGRMFSL